MVLKIKNTMEDLLVFNKGKLKINSLEKQLLEGLGDIVINKRNVTICYPNQNLFLLIVLHTVIKDYAENYKSRNNFTKRISVLVITNKNKFLNFICKTGFVYSKLRDITLEKHSYFRDKNVFCDINDNFYAQCNWIHILHNYYGGNIPEIIPLHFILPVARGYFNFKTMSRGDRNKIGRNDDKQLPVFYCTDNINVLKNKELDVDYIFIDFTFTKKFINYAVNGVLCFFNDSLDDRLIYVLNRSELLNVDAKILSNFPKKILEEKLTVLDENFEMSIQNLAMKRDVHNVQVIYVKSEFENEITKSLELFQSLCRKKFDQYDLKNISSLIYSAIRMPIDATYYDLIAELEQSCDSTNDLLKELRESDKRYEDKEFEEILVLLEDIYLKRGLSNKSPKFEEISKFLIKEILEGKKVGVVVHNAVVSLGLKEQLANKLQCGSIDELKSKGIFFYNKKTILDGFEEVNCDTLILYSAVNLKDLKVLELSNYNRAILFLYKTEILLLKNKLNKIRNAEIYGLKLFTRDMKQMNSISRYLYNRLNRSVKHEREEDKKDLINVFAMMDQKNEKAVTRHKNKNYTGKNAVKATLIEFSDDSYMFIHDEFKVKVLDRGNRRYIEKESSELGEGNELLLINNNIRKELFELVIENIDKSETSKKSYHLIEKWHELFEEKLYNKRLTDEQLYKEMKINGFKKTIFALKNWRNRVNYGPRDLNDIIILGQTLSIDEFIYNADLYFNAMQHVRNERRKTARILNNYIFATKAGRRNLLSGLTNYNLSYEQLEEAVKIKKIKRIKENVYIKPKEIGILFEDEEDSDGFC